MAGIYLHIPFCRKACVYCNFHFSTSMGLKDDMMQAMAEEIRMRREALQGSVLQSVYFGGGTPSLLTRRDLENLLDVIREHFTLKADAEITLEANPDDLTPEKVKMLAESPVNRLSIGIQSFFDDDLRYMGRVHDASDAVRCLDLALQAGFANLSVDLIYGTPTMPSSHWEHNLERIDRLAIPHVSAYQLTVEPRTALEAFIRKGMRPPPADDLTVEQFGILDAWAEQQGYEHYEISNLSKPGWRAVHNSSYWTGERYLGIGPSAHSFDGEMRSWNVANNAKYIRNIRLGQIPATVETLTIPDRYNETVMTGLRLLEGVPVHAIEPFGPHYVEHLLQSVAAYIDNGMVVHSEGRVRIVRNARLFTDRIASDCFMV